MSPRQTRSMSLGLTMAIMLCGYGCAAQGGAGGSQDEKGEEPNDNTQVVDPDTSNGNTPDGEQDTPDLSEGTGPNANDDEEAVLPDHRNDLEVGRSTATLQAAERKTFTLTAERGETLIVNTSLPDSGSNVDMYAYAPGGERPMASSEAGPGQTDNLLFTAEQTGEYAIEVVNILAEDSAQMSLDVQRIPPRGSDTAELNGVYVQTHVNGEALTTNSESWVYSDGEFSSYYGLTTAETLQSHGYETDEDVRYWVDATTGEPCEVHFENFDMSWWILDASTQQDGSSVTTITEQRAVITSDTGRETNTWTVSFNGGLLEDGRILQGSLIRTTNDDPSSAVGYTVEFERQPDRAGR